jgi:hypothetical protein
MTTAEKVERRVTASFILEMAGSLFDIAVMI